ncbi:MAG: Rab family GTPase [Candidatus Hodarchaeales archaeon]
MTILAKIVLLGDGAVGKTSLKQRFMGKGFKTNYLPTLGADFVSKSLEINGSKISLQIWDMAGQPTFKQIRKLYYRNAIGAILVFDITSQKSLLNLKKWLNELIINVQSSKLVLVVLGNKCDILDKEWVSDSEIQETINYIRTFDLIKNDIQFFKTSAKEDVNVNKAFSTVGEEILKFL